MLQVPSSVRAVLLRSSQVISVFRRSQFSRSNMLLLSSSVRSALSVSSPPTMPMVPNLVSAGQVTHGVILMIPLLASVYCACWSRDQGRGPGKKLPPTGGGGGEIGRASSREREWASENAGAVMKEGSQHR